MDSNNLELWEVDYLHDYQLETCISCLRELDPECFKKKHKGKCAQCVDNNLDWPTGLRHCGLCNKNKPYVSFHRDNYLNDGFRTQCKHCVKLRNQRSEEHKKILSERTKDWNIINGYSSDNPNRLPKSQATPKRGKPSIERRKDLRNDPSTDLKPDFKSHLLQYYGPTCLRCNKVYDLDKHKLSHDHVMPVSKGGLHTYANSQPLCLQCNLQKLAKHIDYRTIPILTIKTLDAFLKQRLLCHTIDHSLYIPS